MDDTIDNKAQGVFDLDSFIQGRGFPVATETIYTDARSAYALGEVNEEMKVIAADPKHNTKALKERYASLEKEAEELANNVKASALTFSLRGIAPGHVKKIRADIIKQAAEENWTDDERSLMLTCAWCAPHIISVTNAEGAKDERLFTAEIVRNLADMLPASEWEKLDAKIGRLTFDTTVFDAAVDAGFLPKS